MGECILTIDTCTPAGSVAVTRGEQLLGEVLLNMPANHTDRLLFTVRQLLSDLGMTVGELDAFAVVSGPGSFTGLRVGVGTAKGLAMAAERPLLGVSSLRAVAVQFPLVRIPVCIMLDARKNEVYTALYAWEKGLPVCCGEERVLPPEKALEHLDGEVLFAGNGAQLYRSLIVRQMGARAHFAPWSLNAPRAACAAVLALADLREGRTVPAEQLGPRYIRPSEAEIMWARRVAEGTIEG